jgi:hypothetical protein
LRRCHQISGSCMPLFSIMNPMATTSMVSMTRKENAVRNQGRTPVTGSGELRAVEDTRFGSVSAYSPWLERGSRLSSCCVERIGSRNLSQSSNCGANEWAPTLLATTRIHDANQDPDQQRRSLNGGFSLYRIAARILCLRRPHPEPAASRVRAERISVPLHVSKLRTDYK